jgi:hypothetical protein
LVVKLVVSLALFIFERASGSLVGKFLNRPLGMKIFCPTLYAVLYTPPIIMGYINAIFKTLTEH